MAATPCYVVISPGFEGKDAQPLQWLGRFVQFPESPSARFAPFGIDLRTTIDQFFVDPVTDTNAVTFAQTIRDKSLGSELLSLIGIGRESAKDRGLDVRASKIATFTLCQYEKVLESLLSVPDVRKQILELLRASRRKAYMIVGVKILFTGAIEICKSSTISQTASVNVPVTEIAALTAGVPLPLLGVGDVGFEVGASKTDSSTTRYEIVDRRIFAFQYRVVTFGKTLIRRLSMDPTVSMEAPRYKFDNLVFGDDDDSEDDDNNNGSEQGDTKDDLQYEEEDMLLNEGPMKLADVNDGIGYETSFYGSSVDADGHEDSSGEDAGVFIHKIPDD